MLIEFMCKENRNEALDSLGIKPKKSTVKPMGVDLTAEKLKAIMPSLSKSKVEKYAPLLNSAMSEFSINTPERRNMFLAQLAHESGNLRYMKELGTEQYFTEMYDITKKPKKAKQLGNLSHGDGAKYRGRGPIQVTGKNNYREIGKGLGLDLVNNPELLENPLHAFRSSALWWKQNKVNEYLDKNSDDIKGVSGIVNKGSPVKEAKHLTERIQKYELIKRVLGTSGDIESLYFYPIYDEENGMCVAPPYYDEKRGICSFVGS